MDYRDTVRKLRKLIKEWNLGCYTNGTRDDDAQILVDQVTRNNVTLTREENYAILRAVPGVKIQIWDPEDAKLCDPDAPLET